MLMSWVLSLKAAMALGIAVDGDEKQSSHRSGG